MEAKQTVMSDQQIEDAYGDELPYDMSYEATKRICQAQAGISFNAGKAEGRREERKRIFKEFEERYEVIQHFGKPSPYITFKIRREDWQALQHLEGE